MSANTIGATTMIPKCIGSRPATPTTGKKVTMKSLKTFVRWKLATDPDWATKWLVEIYQEQTTLEQLEESTEEANGAGFSQCDAKFLSSLAEQQIKHMSLSCLQMINLHKRILRYWKQVIELMGRDEIIRCMIEDEKAGDGFQSVDNKPKAKTTQAYNAPKTKKRTCEFEGSLLDCFAVQEEAGSPTGNVV